MNRRERMPIGVRRLKLSIDSETERKLKSKQLVPRWVNDDEGMSIQDHLDSGYMFVYSSGKEKVGTTIQTEGQDRRIKKQVNKPRGGRNATFAYLMAIKQEFYDQDQAEKESINKRVDEAILGGNPVGTQQPGFNPEHAETYTKKINYSP